MDMLWGMMNSFGSKYRTKNTAQNRLKPISFTPCDGRHYFWFRTRLLAFTRRQESNNKGMKFAGGFRTSERLYLTCIGRLPSFSRASFLKRSAAM
jgi:chaperone BCS1